MRLATLVVLAIAGCMQGPISDEVAQAPEIPIKAIDLSGCTGGGARLDAPQQLFEPPVPPGWEFSNGLPVTVSMFVISCEHVSFGSFERGPVQLVLESHNQFSAPTNCREGAYTYLNVLSRIVWSDAEIAAVMEERLGIPTSVGDITHMIDGPEVVSTQTLAWTIGQGKSEIHFGRFQNDASETKRIYRYAWADEGQNRLGLIDFRWDAIQTQLEPVGSYGTFSDPMLLGATGLPLVFGIGVIDEELFPGGDFRFFEGYECATPLP